jgi:hypothetical protein
MADIRIFSEVKYSIFAPGFSPGSKAEHKRPKARF